MNTEFQIETNLKKSNISGPKINYLLWNDRIPLRLSKATLVPSPDRKGVVLVGGFSKEPNTDISQFQTKWEGAGEFKNEHAPQFYYAKFLSETGRQYPVAFFVKRNYTNCTKRK